VLPAVVRRAILALSAAAGHRLVRGARARGAPRAAVLDVLLDVDDGNHILVSRLPQDLNLLLHDGRRLVAKATEVDNLDGDRAIRGGAARVPNLAIGADACVGWWSVRAESGDETRRTEK
jgi:hypothetical protein